jgi:hypothetical protein
MFHDRKSKAGATYVTRSASIDPVETFEYSL